MKGVLPLPLGQFGPQLPQPRRERFVPLRLGIVNIWQYDYQEWWLEGGNLLLRGDNSVGKTKVIELTLPFLLDAQMHPNRLDPFGQREGRSMYWNLLEGGALGQNQREGFTWIEFGRVESEGQEHFVTIGAWLRASSATTKVDPVYFLTPKRVGQELFFPRAGEPTIGKEGLRRQVGEVYTTRREYQQAVDQALFGLGLERYREMVDLLLQLRQPKLSAALKPSKLTGIIADSLPPVDEEQIASLADQYEQLEEYQSRIDELEKNEKGVDRYLIRYRTFVRRQVRLAAEELRAANTAVEDEAKKLDALDRSLETAQRTRQDLESAQAGARESRDAVSGRLDAARQLPEMKTVQQIEQARSEAEKSLETLTDAETLLEVTRSDLATASEEQTRAQQDLRPVQEQLSHAQRAAERAASSADLTVVHQGAARSLLENPEVTLKKMRALARAKREQAGELALLVDQISPLGASLATVREQISEQEAATEQAREAALGAEAAVDQAGQVHLDAIQSWQADLRELSFLHGEIEALQEGALHLEIDASSLLAATRRRASSALEQDVASSLATIKELESREAELGAEITALEQQTEIPPIAPAVRTAERTGRSGAPFYRCVDFRSSLASEQAALLEAGLEASGLLDAWVWPSGQVESDVVDTSVLSGPAVEDSLANYLEPAADGVSVVVVHKILSSLGSDSRSANYFASDGSWRMGGLHGRAFKADAEFVGTTSREQARQRELAQLRAQDQAVADQLHSLQEALSALRARQQQLDAEVASFPSRTGYLEAYRTAEKAGAELESANAVLRQQREQEARISSRLQAVRATLSRRAEELLLTGFIDRLPELLSAIQVYVDQAISLCWAAASVVNLRRTAEKAEEAVQLRQTRVESQIQKVESRRRDYARAKAHAEELENSAEGQAALDTLERVDALKAELRHIEDAIDERVHQIVAAAKAEGDAGGELRALRETHVASSERRARAAEIVTELVHRGAVEVALNKEIPLEGEWSMTRALDLARHEIEPGLQNEPTHPEAIDSARNNLIGAFTDLTSTLHEYAPSLEWHGEIPQTMAVYNQVSVNIRVLRQRLDEEIASQRRLLTEKEKDIFEHFLMADLADHLRTRILRARQQVQDINDNLRAHPTNSGMTLSLRLSEEVEDSNQKLALEYLMKDPSMLRDHERELLREFFQGRIAAARVQEGNQTWREHLTEALDYRRWHKLTIHQHLDGKVTQFTDVRYAAGSGGEKSVSIHQPLFAAAATYYDSSGTDWAPRLIVLDEAFAGIDFPTRGRCLEMAEQFDLDLVMTSYEEMGTHEEISALAIYQMVRDPSRRGVYCERWIWNGQQLQLAEGA